MGIDREEYSWMSLYFRGEEENFGTKYGQFAPGIAVHPVKLADTDILYSEVAGLLPHGYPLHF